MRREEGVCDTKNFDSPCCDDLIYISLAFSFVHVSISFASCHFYRKRSILSERKGTWS